LHTGETPTRNFDVGHLHYHIVQLYGSKSINTEELIVLTTVTSETATCSYI